jgi:hypothetical protein
VRERHLTQHEATLAYYVAGPAQARTFRTEREAFIGPPGKVQQSLLGIGAKKSGAQATP